MSDEKKDLKVLTFGDLETATGRHFDLVPAYGGLVPIASLSSADLIEWLESNDDPVKKREAGLRILVKSVVDKPFKEGDPVEPAHLPVEQRDEFLEKFRAKDARENGRVIKRILMLNGLDAVKRSAEKNESSETTSDVSPSASPSPSVE